ncbi:ABC transporter substrate-binding protein [Aeromonas hydrophila]|uniref:ABC transporter, periplasmic nickel/di-oligopepetide binding protein n=1 Tax=Aeromonas hydrophila subsp. hydrophila (strain ATCC 7966 / DSM 30187 / BCRC 13018 / CCUG 14551 / JCM 1027 / KCTC 2358 / NCIMB 9240 / NCTC 8049) TaxID=380703 RepID=A0KL82_AERHH|nr:ABC transporter substrate-binding protein [Aeromonas hydrophila]ABK36900.1 ABC transporter, periplasmic nickel/di-oligopepetide binding protein [Aeromonas hydrophila subsp. hydrophila ATCC 7966]MBS4672877.1 ABC transporter substrate-binding protein [Aeromonas hydrophila]OOD33512.1 nickel ABC transporter substrate-binding protein [Aeromonas hydrophila]SUU29009.1 nickel/di-oligopepetide ABC transporter substrate-binding protein [Aeromonas hydrophila]
MTIQCFGCHSGSNATRRKGLSVTAAALLALLSGGFSSMALAAQPVPAELKLAIGSEPTEGFDPLLGWSHGSYLLLHSPLLKQNADLSWQNVLTQAVTPNQDGKGWLIRLKPDLTFSNGAPLTAEDVAFTYNSAAQGGGKIDMGNFVSAKVLSPTEVAIVLSAPQSTFVNVLGSLGIVSKRDYDPKAYARHPVGAGPYRLVSFLPGQQLVVEANPHYAGGNNDFKRLVFVFIDEESAYAAAQSSQLDLVRIAPSLAPTVPASLKLWVRPSVENRGIVFPIPPAGGKDAKGYPIGNDVTSDVAVRRAINYAIDRKLLADQLLEGHAIPAYSAVEGLPWLNKATAFKDGDAAHANALLDEAGWKMGSDGVRHKGNLRAAFTLWYTSGDSTRRDLAEAVRAMLKPIGLEVSLKSGSWEQVEREMHANPVLMGWGSLDPMELYHHYQSGSAGVEFYNPGYYQNPVVDGHLKQALDAPDWQAAVPFWQQVEWDGKRGAGVQGDAAWAWLLNVQHTYLANRCIDLGKGAPEIHGSWSLLNNLQDWRWTCR